MVVPAGSLSLSITPTSTNVNAGGSVVFTASGGAGGYAWSVLSGLGSMLDSTYTAPWTGSPPVIVRVTDGTYHTADAVVTVNPATPVQIGPSSTILNAGGTVTFSATGGSGSYSWSKAGAGSFVPATRVYTAAWSAGAATVTATDVDTGGAAGVAVSINAPVALHISPSSAIILTTGSAAFTASGGSGTYSYAMVSGPGTLLGSTYQPGGAGTAVVRATDSFTGQTDDAVVTVSMVPALLAISPRVITIDAGDILTLGVAGGAAPYAYSKISGGGTLVGATYSAPWAAAAAVIRVTDSLLATDEATVTVNAPPALAISPAATTLNVSQSVTFTGSGGSGSPTHYSYAKISGGGTLSAAAYTAPGSATTATIRLTDTATLQTSDAVVTVNAPPPLTFTPATINAAVGDVVTFTPGGGSGSYASSLVSGTGTLSPATYTYTTAIAETSIVRLLDMVTLTTKDATVLSYFPLAMTPGSASIEEGSTYPFAASGGVPPYTYSVTAGAGAIGPSTGLFTAPGIAETDTVKVTDSIANVSTATVTVQPPGQWNIVSIDASSRSGQYASLALDGAGLPRIAYYEGQAKELRLAAWDGLSWSVQTVDSSTSTIGQYGSLALAPGTGYPRISYYDAHNRALRYASWNGSSWIRQTVDSSADVGKYTSLVLEPGTGYPRIAYYDSTNTSLKYAAWNGSSWTRQVVDTPGNGGLNTSLALEPGTNRPRISYYKSSTHDLWYASWNGAAWVVQAVDSVGDVGMYNSLALEPGTGFPRISYYDNTLKVLKYAVWNGAAWNPQTVDNEGNVGSWNSLALEPGTGFPRIGYYDKTDSALKYARWNGATWAIEVVDPTTHNVGTYGSLKLDPLSQKPRIAYYDSSSQDLKYAGKP